MCFQTELSLSLGSLFPLNNRFPTSALVINKSTTAVENAILNDKLYGKYVIRRQRLTKTWLIRIVL